MTIAPGTNMLFQNGEKTQFCSDVRHVCPAMNSFHFLRHFSPAVLLCLQLNLWQPGAQIEKKTKQVSSSLQSILWIRARGWANIRNSERERAPGSPPTSKLKKKKRIFGARNPPFMHVRQDESERIPVAFRGGAVKKKKSSGYVTAQRFNCWTAATAQAKEEI